MYREGKIRATNVTFIFWDLFYPLGYLLVFGVGIDHTLGFTAPVGRRSTTTRSSSPACSAWRASASRRTRRGRSSSIATTASSTRCSRIPMSRAQYLLGKVLFNVLIAIGQAVVTVALAAWLLDGAGAARAGAAAARRRWSSARRVGSSSTRSSRSASAGTTPSTPSRRSSTSCSSSRARCSTRSIRCRRGSASLGSANPITWHVDVLRYLTVGVGHPRRSCVEAGAFVLFTLAGFAVALRSLQEA